MTTNTRQVATGIVANENPQVTFWKRSELRQAIHFIKKMISPDKKKINQKNYLEHLGRINFVLQIVLQINPIVLKVIGYKAVLIDLKKTGIKNEKERAIA